MSGIGDIRCLVCKKEFIRADADAWVTPEGWGLDVGVCPACRTHAAIGRAVSNGREFALEHDSFGSKKWVCCVWRGSNPMRDVYCDDTPLDALKAAGLVEARGGEPQKPESDADFCRRGCTEALGWDEAKRARCRRQAPCDAMRARGKEEGE